MGKRPCVILYGHSSSAVRPVGGWAIVPSGEVSVMPQAWQSRTPSRSYASMSEGGQAAPPMVTWVIEERSRGFAVTSANRPCQMVGTAAAWLGRSRSIMSARGAGWRKRSGMSMLMPVMKVACGRPQALTWNCGTTIRVVSLSVRPIDSAMFTCMECR